MTVTIPTIRFEQLQTGSYELIDVRTPREFAEFHIPGAYNEPIFTNEERVSVGTTYKQIGTDEAKELGIDFLSEKLPGIYRRLKHLHEHTENPLCIYCWRGGLRSQSLASILAVMGIECYQLEGGIRSYRNKIIRDFENRTLQSKPFIVIEGHTGTQKTAFLEKLQDDGYPVLNLEKYAGHRGSVFGAIGLAPHSQKRFDSMLWERLQELGNTPYYIIEGESKRIGRISLPEFILQGKRNSIRINLACPFDERLKTIYSTYRPNDHRDEIVAATEKIMKRLPFPLQEKLTSCLQEKAYMDVFAILLEHYYDPRYTYKTNEYTYAIAHDIYFESFQEGYQKIKKAIADIIANNFRIKN